MSDLLDWWRRFWPTPLTDQVFAPAVASSWGLPAGAFWAAPRAREQPAFTSLDRTRLDLPALQLREASADAGRRGTPILIVAPFALHDATLADFAPGHSLAEVLRRAGPVALIHWKSATHDMRAHTIHTYLAELNIVLDELGGRAVLVGLCQGGWLAAAYAARFPAKVSALIAAGTPLDIEAAPSRLSEAVKTTPALVAESFVTGCGGRVPGAIAQRLWLSDTSRAFDASTALECEPDAALRARFDLWNAYTLDLPGSYFLECIEWIFRENRLARGRFPVFGREVGLADLAVPVHIIAAAQDEIVSLPQALADERLQPQGEHKFPRSARVTEGVHLSLFMGRRTFSGAWREAVDWLEALERPQAPLRRSRSG
jgi:poly(3-hydroxyalkanoate) synthetase